MHDVEIDAIEIENLARAMAHADGHEPDMEISYGPAALLEARFCKYMVAPTQTFAVWRVYERLAQLAIARAGQLAGVQFTVKSKAA